jgi:hypothetical protein
MQQIMVRYKVKPDRVEANEALVRAVYRELHEVAPPGFRYGTYKLDDGVTFIHIAVTEAEAEEDGRVLPKLRAFQAFRRDLEDRAEEGPVSTELEQIGSFRLAGNAPR